MTTTTQTLSNQKVQEFIKANKGKLTTKQMAIKLGTDEARIIGNLASITRAENLEAKMNGANVKIATKVDTNTYGNAEGVKKEEARNLMVNYIVNSKIIGEILGLPHIKGTIEKKINKIIKGMTFLGVERDLETFKLMAELKKILPINLYYGNISDKIYGMLEDTYAHLILDYCGMLPTIIKELQYAMSNHIVKKDGYICLTCAIPVRASGKLFEDVTRIGKYPTNDKNDNRCMSIRGMEKYLDKMCGFDYDVVETFRYYDMKDNGNKGTDMVLFVIKRLR